MDEPVAGPPVLTSGAPRSHTVQSRHARYPFLSAAREAVREEGVDLAELVDRGAPAVERGRERVRSALVDGEIASETPYDGRTELLSYPVARVLVSLLETPGAVEKYAAAEAATARQRFVADLDARRGVDLATLLEEFDLGDAVALDGDGVRVAVAAYLRLAPDGPGWRLVARELADGWVPVDREELYHLLRVAVEERIAAGLPLDVPAAVAEPLADAVDALEGAVGSVAPPLSFDRVDRRAFPPCVDALLSRAGDGEDLDARGRFVLAAFLAACGLDPEEVRTLAGLHDETFAYATERLADGDAAYPPPSCETMVEYGLCVNRDARCETIDHPLAYYDDALDDPDAAPDGSASG
jgi:DNA primase large subunit